jgi:hypothetical protein
LQALILVTHAAMTTAGTFCVLARTITATDMRTLFDMTVNHGAFMHDDHRAVIAHVRTRTPFRMVLGLAQWTECCKQGSNGEDFFMIILFVMWSS